MDADAMDRSDSITAATDGVRGSPRDQNSRRAAACLVCRRSKIKCEKGRAQNDDRCHRCLQLGVHKRTGLEKALHQVEQALRRTGTGIEAAKVVSDLKSLLGPGPHGPLSLINHDQSGVRGAELRRASKQSDILLPDASSDAGDSSASDQDGMSAPQESTPSQGHAGEESLAVDDAENPLQLLARASDLHVSPKSGVDHVAAENMSHQRSRQNKQSEKISEVERFFKLSQFSLDTGPDLDPINLGLITADEADTLFNFFHHNLAHTRWGLDPALYTAAFTRSRSAFLFTSITAAAALFMPSASALSRRLSNHCKTLVNRIILDRYRSVEIVLAFMVNVPWMFPGKHSTDDETCWYVSMATTMALDLSLHKILVPMASLRDGPGGLGGTFGGIARADCIDPKVALALDGFGDVEPTSEFGLRLLRRRERCWISLFVLERGFAKRSVINHPTAPTEVRHFFHAAGLSSALNVMRAAIQGEGQLSSMPNNTAIMISFAACFALRLSGQFAGNSNLAPSVRTLIEETAEVLERVGSATEHRNGMSTLYGKYLKYIVKKAAASVPAPPENTARPRAGTHPELLAQHHASTAYARGNNTRASFSMADAIRPSPPVSGFMEPPPWSEPIQFSSMSDDQIVEALSRVNNEFDPALSMYPWDDAAALDWLNCTLYSALEHVGRGTCRRGHRPREQGSECVRTDVVIQACSHHLPQFERVKGPTHNHAPGDIRRQAPAKDLDSLLLTDAIEPGHGVGVVEAFGRRLGGVGAHTHEDDLGRVPNHPRQTPRHAGTCHGGCGGQLGGF
ncbi:hypothetical protein CHGG_09760 [Chaetomium globosum CBS 148.51]|uniref:Zn(2)-C6 fungal-type domain-containing protein n=1 Tax=Chaetomium globosum (strain ATCC 6205 / CBS 148.51 / DSM 1962 / NBRC 6347 / NRRL 1970) TaxID=306901 RepID=Q2GQJ4_CHAGB|nr:uncharacterized protein CHGG_09760 [Chaetomium globosum CBS 148.51]EAQ83356.1 hypothetical protein CHGG_09760 [Chaetomium globosum CBS 148.51]